MNGIGRLWAVLCALILCAGTHAAVFHSADVDRDSRVSLSELLRVIQFFNSGGYGCDLSGEDGYSVDKTDQSCTPHDSDYNPQDWKIDLPELLRTIQLFNAGGYYGPVISEDSYAPGKGGNPYLLPVEGDTDGDGLTDEEEGYLNMNPAVADEDGDGVPDGVALALMMAKTIEAISNGENKDEWRSIYTEGFCHAPDPATHEPIVVRDEILSNELMGDESGIVRLPKGARFYLEHGSFSYATINKTCQWANESISRVPAHFIYYSLFTIPEYLPGTHLVPIDGDSDGDYLSDAEEVAIGYAPDNPDEDGNGVPDGQDLARAMADKVWSLPSCSLYMMKSSPNKTLLSCGKAEWKRLLSQQPFKADKITERCSYVVGMACYFYDPVTAMYDDTDIQVSTSSGTYTFSNLMLRIMSKYGTLSIFECHFGCEALRLDVPFLFELLNMRGETQLPPSSHLALLENDDDGDYLSNGEEEYLGLDPNNSDENANGTPDGMDIARAFAAAVQAFPICESEEKYWGMTAYTCDKALRTAPFDGEVNHPPATAAKETNLCTARYELDCMLDDPVLKVSIPGVYYRVTACPDEYCSAEFSADSLMLYIMETEGSLGFYIEQNGEWAYNRINVILWNRVLHISI